MNRTLLFKQLYAWLPLILWAGIIFKLSSGSVPSVSNVYIQDFLFKKGAHVFFFGVLGILFYRALILNGVKMVEALVWSFVFVVLYGLSDEYHQSFSQVREARIRDVGFDGFGGLFALLLVKHLLPKLPKRIQAFLIE